MSTPIIMMGVDGVCTWLGLYLCGVVCVNDLGCSGSGVVIYECG